MKALNNRFYVKFMQLEIGLLGELRVFWDKIKSSFSLPIGI